MECLRDYIGLKVCGVDTTPDSGLYVNTLPGISLESLQKIADSEQSTYLGVWEDVQTRGLSKFSEEVYLSLKRCYKIKNLKCAEDIFCDEDNDDILTNRGLFKYALWWLLGAELCIERLNSPRLNKWTINEKKAEELLTNFMIEFKRSLDIAVEGLDIDPCSECFECGGSQVSIAESVF